MYIRATGNISAQNTFGHQPMDMPAVAYAGNRLSCIEPDYKEFIDPKLIRRMSRIIRMGVAAAMECLKEAEIKMPDAIVTGTAYGCMEDTNSFLSKMVEFNEELLTPTAFIQSTHNTIGAQIGLMLQCNNYNNAYVHRGFSFENALLDAIMLLQEKDASTVLVGAVDEIIDTSHTLLSRMGMYKRESLSNLNLYNANTKGTIAGEGASFFMLSSQASATDYAKIDGLHTFYKPARIEEIEDQVSSFLERKNINIKDIDLVITGRNGDTRTDQVYDQLDRNIFNGCNLVNYKHLCGEYPTATSFACWMAANIIRQGKVPVLFQKETPVDKSVKRILVYNHYMNMHHSLFLLSAC